MAHILRLKPGLRVAIITTFARCLLIRANPVATAPGTDLAHLAAVKLCRRFFIFIVMTKASLTPDEEFANALLSHAPRYGVNLSADDAARLLDYYKLVATWNPRLHLVAPCAPDEFAIRHLLESLFALPQFTPGARVLDIGSGAGLPIIPCLIARGDVSATLFESSPKKSVFLREALRRVGLENQARVITARFEKTSAPQAEFVTCRALEHFTEMLSKITVWSPPYSTLLLFGSEKLRARIESLAPTFTALHIPASDRRSLFVISRPSL